MKKELVGSLRFLLMMVVICGGIYTLLVTGVGQLFFAYQSNGSLVKKEAIVGSELIGQNFTDETYFHGRSMEVSQLSIYDSSLEKTIDERKTALQKVNNNSADVPNDLVTGSGSGIDPHISVQSALFQAKRIADSRNLPQNLINDIIKNETNKDWLTGNQYVNVLALNIALDKQSKR